MSKISKTKVAGVAMIVAAVAAVIADAFDGGEFSFSKHFDSLILAFNGIGFYFIRDAVQKVKDMLEPKA